MTATTGAVLFHVDRHLVVGAFVCDALDRDERAEFEQHLQHCGSCRAEVRSFEALAVELVVEAAPPASLRVSVLASIGQVRQASPLLPKRPRLGYC